MQTTSPAGKAEFRAVIDEIAGEANLLIGVLRQHNGATVNLGQPAPLRTRRGRSRIGRRSRSGGPAGANSDGQKPKSCCGRKVINSAQQQMGERRRYRRSVSKQTTPGGRRLRPPAWLPSRSGLPRTNGPPCHPAMARISTSAAASSISMRALMRVATYQRIRRREMLSARQLGLSPQPFQSPPVDPRVVHGMPRFAVPR
jgi:hypothetical protein